MIHGVEVVEVPVPRGEEEAARQFYGVVLGLREINRSAGLGRETGSYYILPDGRELFCRTTDVFRPNRKTCLTFHVASLDALDDVLGRAGHRTEWDFSTARPRFYCQDPFGNRLQFIEVQE